MPRRCLITGGAGFIGSNLARALLESGAEVRVFDDFSTGRAENLEGLDVEIVTGSLVDPDATRRATAGCDVVFHEGAIPSVARSVAEPMASHAANATGTLNVLLAARDATVDRVVYASSSSVYGNAKVQPVHEEMPTRPISPYGVSKLVGERYLEAFHASYGLATVSLRYFNVFGPRQNPNAEYAAVVPRFIAATLSAQPVRIFGDGEQGRDFTFVGDVVSANLLAAAAPRSAWGGTFNVAYGHRHSINELIGAVHALIPGEHPAPIYDPPRPGDVRTSQADVSLARDALGFRPEGSFEEGLASTVAWFSELRDAGRL